MTRRLLLSYLTVTAVVLLMLEIPLGIIFRDLEIDRLTAAVERDAATVATLVEEDVEGSVPLDEGPVQDYAATTGARVVVTDDAGISLVDTAAPAARDFSTRPEVAAALEGNPSSGRRRSETLDDDLLYVAVPVASAGEVYGAVRITLGTRELNERVRGFWLGLVGVGAIVMAAMAGVGWTIARSVTRPIRSLGETAERFATGDLEAEPPDAGAPEEVAQLQRRMNQMAGRLDALLAEQRAFVADASHQLRTPLTALRLRLDNLQQELEAITGDAAAAQAAEVGAAVAEVDRLTALVAGLLRLARLEHGGAVVLERSDLAALTRDRADTWAAVAEAAEVRLVFSDPPPGSDELEVLAVPGAVEQVLDNLVDNAVTAAAGSGGGLVVLSVGRDGGGPWLRVADDGPGLDDEEKRRATDRFWRGDQSGAGSGLGLPIVVELAAAGGGTVELADATEGGLEVTVHFARA